MIAADFRQTRTVLCLGAHSDDIEIGCGGTLLKIIEKNPDIAVHWVVFSANGQRKQEAALSAKAILANCKQNKIDLHAFRDARFPYEEAARIKNCFAALNEIVNPDLVFTHRKDDAHQDHRLIAEMTWQHFRDHLILEYEIPKYEGDLGRPNVFSELEKPFVDKKIETLVSTFASQQDKYWFTAKNFEALMRIRGLECRSESGFAEAFQGSKIVF